MQPDKHLQTIFLVTSEPNALMKERKGGKWSLSGCLLAPNRNLGTLPY